MRVVADTNVLISGLLWPGPSASILDSASRRQIHLLTTEELLSELQEVLSRPHLQPRLEARGRSVTEIMA